ncbi:MAG TPA: threonine--tRNA ligase, partial [Treponemataceae bacterium]|nr:threonine--tRNA ligase [Treponemataceae bacterium]
MNATLPPKSERLDLVRHSTAHVMAEAVLTLFPGAKVAIGPSIDHGFYYDFQLPRAISPDDLPEIEREMRKLINAHSDFVRREVSRAEALELFKDEPFKTELIQDLPESEIISVYQSGAFLDLCRGPHVANTREINAQSFKLMKTAGAYWRGDEKRPMLTRIYGTAWEKPNDLKAYLDMLAEAEKRDHRKLGKELEIFMISPPIGSGLPVWLPNGTFIRRKLENFIKEELIKRGYVEVITPHIGNLNLYKTSGHYPYYSDSQFPPMKVEEEEYLL